MSNAVSALKGKISTGDITIRDAGLQGMILLRGDLGDKVIQRLCCDITDQKFPEKGRANCNGAYGICWMSPDEVLVLVPYDQVMDHLASIAVGLKDHHYLAENVSDARAFITLQGPFVREVIAKLAPVDLHPDRFGPGDMRRSRLGQVAAAFWMQDQTRFSVICFRSVAEYTFDLLKASAQAGPVGHL